MFFAAKIFHTNTKEEREAEGRGVSDSAFKRRREFCPAAA